MRMRSCLSGLLLMLAASSLFAATPIPIKVVIVAMYEQGDDTGDAPGEFQYWVEREHLDQVLDRKTHV